MAIGECIGIAAPYYNLALVVIVVTLFVVLIKIKNEQRFLTPWRFVFGALCVYIVEEVFTVLDGLKVIVTPKLVFPILEMIIISLFIYALLMQNEHLKIRKVVGSAVPIKRGKRKK
jgi:hypothetical protein